LILCLDQGDPQPIVLNGTHWEHLVDLSLVPVGDHQFTVFAKDTQGLLSSYTQCFVKNETGQSWGPQINWVVHQPAVNISAASNVIVYANITATSPFRINHVLIHVDNGSAFWVKSLFRYGEYPEQSRHPEDPRQNESNEPRFGIELGQFMVNETIRYVIEAFDSANNAISSSEYSFTVTQP
jgi:hypothetical protein